MKTPTRASLTTMVVIAVIAAACGGTSESGQVNSPVTTTGESAVDPGDAPAATTTTTQELEPDELVGQAVRDLVDAAAYSFEVEVVLTAGGNVVESELEGWVRGDDRELTLRSDGQQVTTRVLDGIATVEREGEVVEVPLEQASDAPSLDVLLNLRGLTETTSSTFVGSLTASDLKDLGFEVNGTAEAEIKLSPSGALDGYRLNGNNGAWTVTARFFDVEGTS